MADRPILFSGPMVRAILSGTKTQTRRVVRWPVLGPSDGRKRRVYTESDAAEINASPRLCPFGAPGDLLWVRETWAMRADVDPTLNVEKARRYLRFAADGEDLSNEWHDYGGRWRPSIHMPRWASRLSLRVTSVRVERLHAITPADIVAEGVRVPVSRDGSVLVEITGKDSPMEFLAPKGPWTPEDHLRAQWASLWARINGRASWDANPWVWVIGFEREEVSRG